MLHLLPVRIILSVIIVLIAVSVLAAVYGGVLDTGNDFKDLKTVMRYSPIGATILLSVPYILWRWVPSLQRITFPYLGGKWSGELKYQGARGNGTRAVDLHINHSLLQIKLVLDSTESTSRTLLVHPERDVDINRNRLYYVYLNERKEGVPGAGERYRGLAVLRVEMSPRPTLHGDYFTETRSSGTLTMQLKHAHPWWAVWK